MVTGGVAAVVYGGPRFTRDIDVVLELDESQIGKLEVACGGGAVLPTPPLSYHSFGQPTGGPEHALLHHEVDRAFHG